MARVAAQLTNFTAGELSPRLDGRNDLAKYSAGCATVENMVIYPHGAAARRPGTQYVAEVKTSANSTRIIPFEFNTEQTYILELGNLYMRFYRDNGQILEGNKTITAITKANPGVITCSSHDYLTGDEINISSIVGMTELNNKRFLVVKIDANTFSLTDVDGVAINTTNFTTYGSAGTMNRVFQITTTYTTAEIFDLKFAQSADVMYITHPNHQTRKLSRTGHTTWTLAAVEFTNGPFLDTNVSTTTLTPASAGVGTGVNVTASAVAGVNGGSGFLTTDVGRQIRIGDGYGIITARTNTTVVVVTVTTAFANANANTDWSLGAFSTTTGFPSCVSFFEQRLVFAASINNPQTVYFSKSGDYENMDANIGGTVADDDAIIYTIASNQVNAIRFMSSARTLIIGTAGGEFVVSGGGDNNAVTPTNIMIKKQSNHGAANVDAISVGNATLFLQRAKRKIRELAYNFDVDGYIAPDLTILAEHITEGNVVEMAYQEEPLAIIWCVRGDGQLIALTYQREQEVVAWHRHIIGGSFGTGNAVVESVAVIPTEDSEYELYVVVKRTINNITRRYVEYLHTFNFTETDNTSFNYLDSQLSLSKLQTTLTAGINAAVTTVPVASVSGLSTAGKIKIGGEIIAYTGISTLNLTGCTRGQNSTTAVAHLSGAVTKEVVNTISGLDHLEGQTVSILADGATHPTKVVDANGAITLDRFATDVKIGLQYTSILKTMRIDAGSQDGTSQGKTKRIYEVTARLFETVGVEVGPDLNNMERIPFRTSADPMDQGIPPFTGDKQVEFRGNYDTDGFMMVRQTQPLPLTLLSLYPRLVTNDG
jgi:hypothetical protein